MQVIDSSEQNKKQSIFLLKLRNIFLTGLFALLPLVVTYYILSFLLDSMTGFLLPYFDMIDKELGWNTPIFLKKILSFFVLIIIILITGLFTKNYFGKRVIIKIERLVEKIPLVKTSYNATKQIIATFQSTKTETFKKVVLVEYPRKGIYSVGFVTNNRSILQDGNEDKYYTIFIVTTPNPTSGFIIIVPKDEVVVLDIPVQSAFKFIISAGVLLPSKKVEKLENGKDV
ncbi:protein of unknown function DUF502 [Calditerrivibrio nitroreducens DSM 19672]|uniref:DUF502 domain-containing protein n=1 Tax=Calditerrivibrio nitroreducens (strain DSM 19672 / NBRC 101217 / Yu37-1) TaxID=768670 RepID=E4TFI4_CALNY|nr:protein of unknown function DUF502 [Calditerrivibrio nitroreducens DSM 19672]